MPFESLPGRRRTDQSDLSASKWGKTKLFDPLDLKELSRYETSCNIGLRSKDSTKRFVEFIVNSDESFRVQSAKRLDP